MIQKDLLEQIDKLNMSDMIELHLIINEKCEELKKKTPHYRVLKYNAKNRDKINEKQKIAYQKKKQLKEQIVKN